MVVIMRNILIILFVGVGLISAFGCYVSLNDGHNLLKKLDKFEDIDNLYYQSQFRFKIHNNQDVDMIVKQYKKLNNYFAQNASSLSDDPTNIEVNNGILSFDQGEVIVKGSVEESEKDRSIFWLDKLTSDDVIPDSIKKIKTPKNFEAGKCDMYSAKHKIYMCDFDICMNKNNVPVYIKYYNFKKFIPFLFDINLPTNSQRSSGDIIIKVTDIKFNSEYDSSFDLDEDSESKEILDVKEIKKALELQKSQINKLDNSVKELEEQSDDEIRKNKDEKSEE